MKTIYVFGNEFLDIDNFALKVANHLNEFKIIKCRNPDELLDAKEDIIILDVVKGIRKTMIIKNVASLKVNSLMSMHDFDLGYFLNLMESLDLGLKVKIIGIPQTGDSLSIADDVRKCTLD